MTSNSTSPTLLQRLKNPRDQDAWNLFVRRYGPGMFGWCRGRGLQDSDAADVTQEVLTKLVTAMRTFSYDCKGSFRSWLQSVTLNAVRDYLKSAQVRRLKCGEQFALEILATKEAQENLETRLKGEFDLELREEAESRVQASYPKDWAAFDLVKKQGKLVDEVAETLGRTRAAVHMAVSRTVARLRQQFDFLQNGKSFEERP